LFQEEPEEKTAYQKSFDYGKPALTKSFLTRNGGGTPFLQLGGEPDFIQSRKQCRDALQNDSYQFCFSVDEAGYLKDTVHGNDPFCYGAIYFYAKISENAVAGLIAGFWCCS
jgi:hypothetical protein